MTRVTRNPRMCVLRTDGTNCDEEMKHAWQLGGGEGVLVHINELRANQEKLFEYSSLGLPGGFSHGDAIRSGKIHAIELIKFLGDVLPHFVEEGRVVLGICNGFQVLVQSGLLPGGKLGKIEATLIDNEPEGFQCVDTPLEICPSKCVFTEGIDSHIVLPRANGEGRFVADEETVEELEKDDRIPVRYEMFTKPNGSMRDIAGICNEAGNVLGMMPHPERAVEFTQMTNWRRMPPDTIPPGLPLFLNGVRYARQL